jgi:type I restriction enzyme M protein
VQGQRFESEATLARALGAAAAAAWEDVDYPFEDTEFLGGKDPFGEAMNLKPATAKKLLKLFAIQDPDAPMLTNRNGDPEPDPNLRDNENISLPDQAVTFDEDPTERLADEIHQQAVHDYMDTEVLPYVADAWVDRTKTKLGYEIPLTRHFYTYTPPRPLTEIDAEIAALEAEIRPLLEEWLDAS